MAGDIGHDRLLCAAFRNSIEGHVETFAGRFSLVARLADGFLVKIDPDAVLGVGRGEGQFGVGRRRHRDSAAGHLDQDSAVGLHFKPGSDLVRIAIDHGAQRGQGKAVAHAALMDGAQLGQPGDKQLVVRHAVDSCKGLPVNGPQFKVLVIGELVNAIQRKWLEVADGTGPAERGQRGSRRSLVGRIFDGRVQFLLGQSLVVIGVPSGEIRCHDLKKGRSGSICDLVAPRRSGGHSAEGHRHAGQLAGRDSLKTSRGGQQEQPHRW